MPDALKRRLRDWLRRKEQMLPLGFSMTIVAAIDTAMAVIGGIGAVQRPLSEWPIVLIAMVIALSPEMVFFGFDLTDVSKFQGPVIWAAWMTGTGILLFATPMPITGDFAPLLVALTVGVVAGITSTRGGALAAASGSALLVAAAVLHRINTPALYLSFVVIAWLVGFLMRTQQELLTKQGQMQDELARHAAADERRRIAREVHDVIAHSLSVTLLHLTGARHAIQYGSVDDETVRALQRAEHLGRQAMADIRHTVGLLDADTTALTPQPGIADIPDLVQDFSRAGLHLTFAASETLDDVSAAAGLALYRIAQESLSNIAKHAPGAASWMTLTASETEATLSVVSELPRNGGDYLRKDGRGLRGMKRRIELLGGTIDIGPRGQRWSVVASVPAGAHEPDSPDPRPAA